MKKLILAAMLAALTQAGLAQTPIAERAPLKENASLEAVNVAGSIEITGWRQKEIEVSGTLEEGAELVFEADGDRALVKVENEDRNWKNRDHDSSGTKLVIRVPYSTQLNVKTVSADVKIAEIRGIQRVRTVSGDLNTTVESDEAELRTVSGDVTATGNGKKGSYDLYTVSGDLTATGFAGEVHAEAVSSDVNINVSNATEVRLKTVSGDIEARLGLEKDAKVQLESVSGDVEVSLPKNYAAAYELSSFSGDISDLMGKKAASKSQYSPGSELAFTHGSGSGRIRINTLSGDIGIKDDM